MAAELVDLDAVGEEDLADEEAEFAIAQDGDVAAFGDFELFEDFAGGGDGFGEDGLFAKKRPTLMFNGYQAQVASLYTGMDLAKFY